MSLNPFPTRPAACLSSRLPARRVPNASGSGPIVGFRAAVLCLVSLAALALAAPNATAQGDGGQGDGQPVLSLRVALQTIPERDGTATVTVNATPSFATDQTIRLELRGDAVPGRDYRFSGGELNVSTRTLTIKLPEGQRSVGITLIAIDDMVLEPDEVIRITAYHIADIRPEDDQLSADASDVGGQQPDEVLIGSERVFIDDDDVADVEIGRMELELREGDVPEPYTVVLTSQPEGEVRVTVRSDNDAVTVPSEPLTFNPQNWRQQQNVTVTAEQDDDAQDENATITHAVSGYGDVIDAAPVMVSVEDDDVAGVEIGRMELELREGDVPEPYTVVLTSQPEGEVRVTVRSDNDAVTVPSEPLTFNPQNWRQQQNVTVTAEQDDDAQDENATITHAVSGYGDVIDAAPVMVSVEDDDVAGVEIGRMELELREGDVPEPYTVVLTSQPEGEVRVTVRSDNDAVTVPSEPLTFNPQNWRQQQNVTVTAEQDDDAQDENATITHAVSGYGDVIDAAPVMVSVEDDDDAGVEIGRMELKLREGGVPEPYTVVLTSQPEGEVRVTVRSDNDAVTVPSEPLTFNPQNWGQHQNVTVTAEQDDDAQDENATITHEVSGYGDGIGPHPVMVSVEDDDVAGVEVTPTVLELQEGGIGAYTVVLTSAPEGVVTVTVASGDDSAVTVSPQQLSFDYQDYDVAQSVTVTSRDDDEPDRGRTVMLSHEVLGYGSVTVALAVTVAVAPDRRDAQKVVEQTLEDIVNNTISNVTTNIGTRFSAARGGTAVTVAGRRIPFAESALAPAAFGGLSESSWFEADDSERRGRDMTLSQLLETSSFQVALAANEEGTQAAQPLQSLTVWGRVDRMFFDKESGDANRYDGDLSAGYVGLDTWLDDRWLIGAAASVTKVKAGYGLDDGGKLDLSMVGLHPYLRLAVDDLSEVWVILGVSLGKIQNMNPGESEREKSDITMTMGAAGLRRHLATLVGIDFALLGDAGYGRLKSGGREGLQVVDNLTADSWRARLGFSGSHTVQLQGLATFTPFVEVVGRYDGGGDENGGVEIAGGIQYANPVSGLGFELRANVLPVYSDEDYREYGFSLSASASPGIGGEGLAMLVATSLGPESGSTEAMLRRKLFGPVAAADDLADALSLNAEVGYGFPIVGSRTVLAPFGGLRLRDGGSREMRTGMRLSRMAAAAPWNLELAGEQRESDYRDTEYLLSLLGRVQF